MQCRFANTNRVHGDYRSSSSDSNLKSSISHRHSLCHRAASRRETTESTPTTMSRDALFIGRSSGCLLLRHRPQGQLRKRPEMVGHVNVLTLRHLVGTRNREGREDKGRGELGRGMGGRKIPAPGSQIGGHGAGVMGAGREAEEGD